MKQQKVSKQKVIIVAVAGIIIIALGVTGIYFGKVWYERRQFRQTEATLETLQKDFNRSVGTPIYSDKRSNTS